MLAKIIALGGLAMSLSHATTPMSGFEHVISHVLDLQAEIEHSPLAVHGSQVALAALAGAEMYRRFLSDFEPLELTVYVMTRLRPDSPLGPGLKLRTVCSGATACNPRAGRTRWVGS